MKQIIFERQTKVITHTQVQQNEFCIRKLVTPETVWEKKEGKKLEPTG